MQSVVGDMNVNCNTFANQINVYSYKVVTKRVKYSNYICCAEAAINDAKTVTRSHEFSE